MQNPGVWGQNKLPYLQVSLSWASKSSDPESDMIMKEILYNTLKPLKPVW